MGQPGATAMALCQVEPGEEGAHGGRDKGAKGPLSNHGRHLLASDSHQGPWGIGEVPFYEAH